MVLMPPVKASVVVELLMDDTALAVAADAKAKNETVWLVLEWSL